LYKKWQTDIACGFLSHVDVDSVYQILSAQHPTAAVSFHQLDVARIDIPQSVPVHRTETQFMKSARTNRTLHEQTKMHTAHIKHIPVIYTYIITSHNQRDGFSVRVIWVKLQHSGRLVYCTADDTAARLGERSCEMLCDANATLAYGKLECSCDINKTYLLAYHFYPRPPHQYGVKRLLCGEYLWHSSGVRHADQQMPLKK